MHIPRSRGAVTGVLLVVLGAWGALAPLIGPSFDFSTDSTSTWSFTTETVWLSVVPGVAAVIGGLILLTSANRATAGLGAWLAIAAGAWFVAGDEILDYAVEEAGVWEQLAAFAGLGAAIAALAAFALGRLAVRSARDEELDREAELADRDGDGVPDRPRTTRESGRFDRAEPAGVSATDDTRVHDDTKTAHDDTGTTRNDTLSAADRVRDASARRRGGLFRRN